MLANKLKDLMGPLMDLPPIDQTEVKFNGRSRLYIGNLTGDVTEDEITSLFAPFGETAELFLNKEKNFGFIKMVRLAHLTLQIQLDNYAMKIYKKLLYKIKEIDKYIFNVNNCYLFFIFL